jgi:hypothetical protein
MMAQYIKENTDDFVSNYPNIFLGADDDLDEQDEEGDDLFEEEEEEIIPDTEDEEY